MKVLLAFGRVGFRTELEVLRFHCAPAVVYWTNQCIVFGAANEFQALRLVKLVVSVGYLHVVEATCRLLILRIIRRLLGNFRQINLQPRHRRRIMHYITDALVRVVTVAHSVSGFIGYGSDTVIHYLSIHAFSKQVCIRWIEGDTNGLPPIVFVKGRCAILTTASSLPRVVP